jgi:hypothetical protein
MTLWAASQPNLRKKCVVSVGMHGARSNHELFIPSLPPAELSELGLMSHLNME